MVCGVLPTIKCSRAPHLRYILQLVCCVRPYSFHSEIVPYHDAPQLLTFHRIAMCIKISHPRKLRVLSLHDVLQDYNYNCCSITQESRPIPPLYRGDISVYCTLHQFLMLRHPSRTRNTISLLTFFSSQSLEHLQLYIPSIMIQNVRLPETKRKTLQGC